MIHVDSFDLPLSDYLSEETRTVLARQFHENEEREKLFPFPAELKSIDEIVTLRKFANAYYDAPIIAKLSELYNVDVRQDSLSGVGVEVFLPADGMPPINKERVLINIHGGGFIMGGTSAGRIESIPIAAVGKLKVVAVDYRMAPEHKFPAVTEDVLAVYEALLEEYKPENVGIYGCSAGGLATGEVVASIRKNGLPSPGAIGMFCYAPTKPVMSSDSANLMAGISPTRGQVTPELSYFAAEDLHNPYAFPGLDSGILATFPESLLITSTRDAGLSSIVVMHSELTRLGVNADLHVWEGMGHAFFTDPDLPESREAYNVIASFFNRHLGR